MEMNPIAAGAFAGLLEQATGQQIVAGRRWRIETALSPLMRAHGIDTLDRLAAEIGRDRRSPLATTVVEALLNNETFFFRDLAAFRGLDQDGLATLARACAEERRLRIWSAGCSTGQEVYSLAMAIARDAARWEGWDITILGTDVSHQVLAQARKGSYGQLEVQRGLPIGDMLAYFETDGKCWRIAQALRAQVSFLQHNLFDPPPTGPFDLILCRNVLLYFVPERRRQVLDNLAKVIAPHGVLMLGAGETVLGSSEAFVVDPVLRGLYRPAPA